ncbi:MAG TPA: type II toxin-antitoxin system PemK/MazF family toxin [Xanthomonadales bacterium]|nr:type II toxin-antitoxin system PemK/MazF family toxin [Xanthomonadales bacterium]
MTFKRGSIYLANFNPAKGGEPGMVRPCLVIQTDALNDSAHRTTTVLPLTTRLLNDSFPMRVTIEARDKLQQTSQIMVDQVRSIDRNRFTSDTLTILKNHEMALVEAGLKTLLELEN